MAAEVGVVLGCLALAVVGQLLAAVALAWWAANVGRALGGAWRWLVLLPLAGQLLAAGGVIGSWVYLKVTLSGPATFPDPVVVEHLRRALWPLSLVPTSWALLGLTLLGCLAGASRAARVRPR